MSVGTMPALMLSASLALAIVPTVQAQYLIEDANGRDLSAYDVSGLATSTHSGPDMVRIARNEIFARHGYVFQSEDLQTWFEAQPWYSPSQTVELTEQELRNVRILSRVEDLADDPNLLFHHVPRDQGSWRATLSWSSDLGTRLGDTPTLQAFGGPDGARVYVGEDMEALFRPVEELRYVHSMSQSYASVEPVSRYAYYLDPAYLAGLDAEITNRQSETWQGETVTRFTFASPEGPDGDTASGDIWVTDDGIMVRMDAQGFYEPQPGDFADWQLRFELSDLVRLDSYDETLFGWPEVTDNIGAPG